MTIQGSLYLALENDLLSKLFLVLISAVWLLAAVFAGPYLRHAGRERQFQGFYTMTLGALMGLGIERELIGDIVLREAGAYIFCVERMVDFICQSLVQIGRTDVRCERAEPPQGALRETREVRLQVSSPRLDAIAAHLFHLSRGDAQQLFRQGRVMVDDAPCERPDYQLRDGQVISVRGYGRAQYLGVDGQSKKGKDVVRIALYS